MKKFQLIKKTMLRYKKNNLYILKIQKKIRKGEITKTQYTNND